MLSSLEGRKEVIPRLGKSKETGLTQERASTWISDAVMSGRGRGGTHPRDGVHLPAVKERLGGQGVGRNRDIDFG